VKYKNVKTKLDGITFDSKKEAKRYEELKMLLKYKEISELELQPKYPLTVNGVIVSTYIADFRYVKKGFINYTVEDVKGVKTPVYRLKKKLMKAIYSIDILET
jgi:hypothetical protein